MVLRERRLSVRDWQLAPKLVSQIFGGTVLQRTCVARTNASKNALYPKPYINARNGETEQSNGQTCPGRPYWMYNVSTLLVWL